MATNRPRTRLSPEARKLQLLAVAKQMIVDDGLQRFTMEALARLAAVSSPLVYNYFASREALLQTLLVEEFDRYARDLSAEVAAAESFEDVIRVFIASNFDHHAPGNILPILQSQPEIAVAVEESRAAHGREIARYLVRHTAENYKISKDQAGLVVRMSSGASIAAAEYAALTNSNREKTINTALAYVLAGLSRIARHSG